MRRRLLAPAALLLLVPSPALAQSGGVAAPSGGAAPRVPLRATQFGLAPGTVQPGGAPVTFTYRIDGPVRRVRVRIDIVGSASRVPVARIRLGWKPTRQRRTYRWALRAGAIPAGDYQARLHAVDDAGSTLRRTASASGRSAVHVDAAPVQVGSGLFPVRGQWTYGGEEARFGADRGTHVHQGQDVMAAEGTPIVTPRAGYVYWKAYQERGAGHYLVVRADDGRDLVFMHLLSGSPTVGKGDPVTAGQQIAQVGNTGRSEAPHLHFEIWPSGWYAKDSRPIDPRPDLDAWAGLTPASPG